MVDSPHREGGAERGAPRTKTERTRSRYEDQAPKRGQCSHGCLRSQYLRSPRRGREEVSGQRWRKAKVKQSRKRSLKPSIDAPNFGIRPTAASRRKCCYVSR